MLIIPAIDIRGGKCVRLVKGRLEEETVYSDNPAEIAQLWEEKGAPMLHLVDLDGAFAGEPKNLPVIRAIRERVSVPLEVGGGIRTLKAIEDYLDMGIDRVILGTAAVSDPQLLESAVARFGERIAVGVDNKQGKVAVDGWKDMASSRVLDFVENITEKGVRRVIYTDTSRDGTLTGPDLDDIAWFLEAASDLKIIVSGGISSIDDIRELALLALYYPNMEGVIIGKSLYSKSIELEEALEIGGH